MYRCIRTGAFLYSVLAHLESMERGCPWRPFEGPTVVE